MISEAAVGGLESVIGPGFAEALQQGLVRVAQQASSAPSGSHVARQLASRNPASPVGGPGPECLDAVLRRFESALPATLNKAVRWDSSVRQALNDRARAVLAAAFGTEPAAGGGGLPDPPVKLAPHHHAAAAVLLMECAMLQMMESGRLDEGAVRVLGEAARRAGESEGRANQSECCWQEQRRISRELHDDVADGVIAAREALEECEGLLDPVAAGRVAAARDALRGTDARLRDLVGGVRERSVVPPLDVALREFAVGSAPGGVQVSVRVTGDEGLIPDVGRRDLYFTAREALRNCFAHSGGGRVRVFVRSTRWWAYARVEDDGRGFDVERVLRPGHCHQGFRSMTERMEDAGGRLTVSSSPGRGTHVEAHLPLQPYRHGARTGPSSG
ncbi:MULTISPECIES: sensor histidine kinase [Streptomyces]|uniref:sensor histidine kinase n=1 Tax=Streptomyces TaxID=1883 RepID=UPI000F557825|nr:MULTISPECIES: ATP-binding protein [Streptomyces]MDX3067346.1 histidine kinase [Streptomyces sp. ND04-05B]RPK71056.1 Sensor protein VraS [Streptomyces sp. ADI97-07]WRY80132.1 histidine kinase [Streptomyces clavifer]WRY86188.1 histidine kinase [Streptomyces clavifer]WUC25913.1 histidine kinase [Streptomyces clavifer]